MSKHWKCYCGGQTWVITNDYLQCVNSHCRQKYDLPFYAWSEDGECMADNFDFYKKELLRLDKS